MTEIPLSGDEQSGRDFPPTAAVVIPTRYRSEDLDRCLAALSRQSCDFPYDVIVVDNSPGDVNTESVAGLWGARYVREPGQGLCRARNRGALVTSAGIVAYLDDDSVPDPSWLTELAREFEDPRVMAVAGRTLPLQVETESERLFAKVRGRAYDRPDHLVVDRNNPHWFEICCFGGIGPGCNMALRRTAFEVWPGFNERIDRGTPVHGGGEHHAFFSLVDRGFAVAYSPRAVVRHPFAPTMEVLRRRHLQDLTASTAYFTMLLVEEPRHRKATLRYLLDGIRGRGRSWRDNTDPHPPIVSRAARIGALALGPVRYLQSFAQRRAPALRPFGDLPEAK